MFSIECGKVIRSPELDFIITCNYCLLKFTEIEKFSLHFNNLHLYNIKSSDENEKIEKSDNLNELNDNVNEELDDGCEIKTEIKEEDEEYCKGNEMDYDDESSNNSSDKHQDLKAESSNETQNTEETSDEEIIINKSFKSNIEGEEWLCKICGIKLTVNRRQKQAHLQKHRESIIQCTNDCCKEYFQDEIELNTHLEEYHSNNPNLPFKCSTCTKLFKTKAKLTIHNKRVHLNDKRFKCSLCEKRFFENKDRTIHERTHTKETFCDKSFKSNIEGEEWLCKICGIKLTVNRRQKRAHLQKHRENSFQCTNDCCKEYFQDEVELNTHLEEHHSNNPNLPFKCSTCKKLFKTKAKLKIHNKRVHLNEKRFKCSLCEKRFFENTDRTIHERTHTKETFCVCEVCGQGFKTKGSLRAHRERKHYKELNMPTKEFKCNFCDKTFHRKDYLNSHLAMHSTEKKYTCKICSLSFSWSSGLKRHMNVHNNERDFVCKLCGKDFTSKIRITCHMKSHGLPYINENVIRKSESESNKNNDS